MCDAYYVTERHNPMKTCAKLIWKGKPPEEITVVDVEEPVGEICMAI